MKNNNQWLHGQSGQIMILALTFSAVLLSLIAAIVGYWLVQANHQRHAIARTDALNIAEAAVELAIWKLNNQAGYSGETNTAYGNGTFNIVITNTSGTTKQIRAEAYTPNATNPTSKRVVQVSAVIGTVNVGFNYGVQVGNGGLEMNNSSQILGNVYSNGDIRGGNTSNIQGTALVAGTGVIDGMDVSGNAQAYTIRNNSNIGGNATVSSLQNSDVTGNVTADSISNCTIDGSATYDTRSSCNVSGTATTPNPNAYSQLPELALPITEDQIDLWEQEAEEGGTIGTLSFSSGTNTIGPKKINGDLNLSNTAQLILTGTLWVTGNINVTNSAIIRLSSSYNSLSGVVIAGVDESSSNGMISLKNSSQALGSGTAGSYLLLLSQKEGTAATAIDNDNTGTSAILYAGEGAITIGNSGAMKEVTAEELVINNSATITYETGLANANFSSGPSGGWEVSPQTWQLLQ